MLDSHVLFSLFRYDKWVVLSFRSRYKYVFEQTVANLKHRIKTFPTSSTAWRDEKIKHLLVYDDTEVGQVHADTNMKDAMFLCYINLPAGAVTRTALSKAERMGRVSA